MEILAYITSHEGMVLSGNPLCFFIQDESERQQMAADMCRSLEAKAIQLKNGDYIIVDV